jgi:hypothetical protein
MRKLTVAVVAAAALAIAGAAHATGGNGQGSGPSTWAQVNLNSGAPPIIGGCTMALPTTHATVEAEVANAADFCEVMSYALAGDVFRAPLIVTPGRLWHYADAAVLCRLRFGQTADRITIRNAPAAGRWVTRPPTGWHREAAAPVYAP